VSNRWPPGTMKVHENCGGLIRWVEAVETPAVGYVGHCLRCNAENIVVEDMIPIQTEPGEHPHEIVNQAGADSLADLEWDDDASWDENQSRLRNKVVSE
jgi:hypothetical protein